MTNFKKNDHGIQVVGSTAVFAAALEPEGVYEQ